MKTLRGGAFINTIPADLDHMSNCNKAVIGAQTIRSEITTRLFMDFQLIFMYIQSSWLNGNPVNSVNTCAKRQAFERLSDV
jgi:hypothetical protein